MTARREKMRKRCRYRAVGCPDALLQPQPLSAMTPLLQLEDLHITFATPAGQVQAVRGVDLELHAGETLAIVGESGCGKSVLCRSILRLLPDNARITGRILLEGRDIVPCSERQMRAVRGPQAAMLFQDPMASLNPTLPVGDQIMEALRRHRRMRPEQARQRALELLELVGIDDPEARMRLQPHYFSGGMRQRCVLAIALALGPRILLADEPTTALDVTVQARMLDLLRDVQRKTGVGIILVSHDLGVVARVADRVAVMYAGRLVETGSAADVFYDPRHPYTWGLLGALPALAVRSGQLRGIPGMPPSLLDPPPGDAFAERNAWAMKVDYQRMPPFFEVGPGHKAATWLLHPQAPKVEPPLHITPGQGSASLCWTDSAHALEMSDSRYAFGEGHQRLHDRLAAQQGTDAATAKDHAHGHARDDDDRPLLELQDLRLHFRPGRGLTVRAVDGLDLAVRRGEMFGLVGESGCGKSTLARAIMGLYPPTTGRILFDGHDIHDPAPHLRQERRRQMQIIFQDSSAALNPHMRVEDIIAEPFVIQNVFRDARQRREEVVRLLGHVGLDAGFLDRYPAEISGGQRQRVAIARSVALEPRFIVADEPVASLDVSIQAQIMALFRHLRQGHDFTFLFIAHDLAMVRYLCDRVGVMRHGRLVELAPTEELFARPLHAYTQALLSAMPVPDPLFEQRKKILPCPADEDGGAWREVHPGHWLRG